MLKGFLKNLNKNAIILVIISPIVTFILLSIFKLNLVGFIRLLGRPGNIVFDYIESNKLIHSANYTLTVGLINSLAYIFTLSPNINITVRNKFMKDDLTPLKIPNLPNHAPSSLIVHIDIDYKCRIWYKAIDKLGGILIEIETPDWVEPTLNNMPWDNRGYVKDTFKNLIQIDISKALNNKLEQYKGEVFVGMDVITNMTKFNESFIEIKIFTKSNKKIKNKILSILIKHLCSVKYKKHKLVVGY